MTSKNWYPTIRGWKQSSTIEEQREVIGMKDMALVEKDIALAEKDSALAEKDAEIARLKAMLSGNNINLYS